MDTNKYLEESSKTLGNTEGVKDRINVNTLHAVVGLTTETGELVDAVKKQVFYGKELDRINVIEEVGDCLFYIAILCRELDFTFEEAMEKNIAKLKARYKGKFTEKAALDRDVEAERAIMESLEWRG
jgi:NTP pyrophosphatase (non-canonical NTP hydrolase)